MLKKLGNTIKNPIVKTFGNSMKKSMGIFSRSKNTIKNVAFGIQENYMKVKHNFGSNTMKYLGKEGIKKFKHMAPQAAKGSNQLARTQGKQNIQMRSAVSMGRKVFSPFAKGSTGQMKGQELGSLINMVSKSKPQLPFLFGGGLMRMAQVNLVEHTPGMKETKADEVEVSDEMKQNLNNIKNADKSGAKSEVDMDAVKAKLAASKKIFGDLDFSKMNEAEMAASLNEVTEKFRQQQKETPKETPKVEQNAKAAAVEPKKVEVIPPKQKGKIEFDIGEYYGEVVNGEMVGKVSGKITFVDKTVYEGEFIDQIIKGKGVWKTPSGEVYKGTFDDGKFNGKGTWTNKAGDKYEGEFVGGKMSGRGTFTYVAGGEYSGEFLDGKYHGQGSLKYKSGNLYDGGFKENEKCGYGEYYLFGGCYYKGNWLNDAYNGEGTQYTRFDKKTQKGEFKDGVYLDPQPTPVEAAKPAEVVNDASTAKAAQTTPVPPQQAEDNAKPEFDQKVEDGAKEAKSVNPKMY